MEKERTLLVSAVSERIVVENSTELVLKYKKINQS